MKRIISFALVAAMLLTLCLALTSCEKAECNTCGEEFFAKDKNISGAFGIEIYTCNDCLEDYEKVADGLGELFGK